MDADNYNAMFATCVKQYLCVSLSEKTFFLILSSAVTCPHSTMSTMLMHAYALLHGFLHSSHEIHTWLDENQNRLCSSCR